MLHVTTEGEREKEKESGKLVCHTKSTKVLRVEFASSEDERRERRGAEREEREEVEEEEEA